MKNKENIYLDLSKLSGEEIKEVEVLSDDNIDEIRYYPYFFWNGLEWDQCDPSIIRESKLTEIDLSEFRQLFSDKVEYRIEEKKPPLLSHHWMEETSKEVLQVENKINIDELTKLCNEYNRSNLKISNLKRDLEYKNNWSEQSVAIQEIKQQISILQKIKETSQSKLQDIGIEF